MQGNVCVSGKLVSECFYIYAAVIMFNLSITLQVARPFLVVMVNKIRRIFLIGNENWTPCNHAAFVFYKLWVKA